MGLLIGCELWNCINQDVILGTVFLSHIELIFDIHAVQNWSFLGAFPDLDNVYRLIEFMLRLITNFFLFLLWHNMRDLTWILVVENTLCD